MGIENEIIRKRRNQKIVNNAGDYFTEGLSTNGIHSNTTTSTESTPLSDRPLSKPGSRSGSSRTTATRIVHEPGERSDASDGDAPYKLTTRLSLRRKNGVYPLREIEPPTFVSMWQPLEKRQGKNSSASGKSPIRCRRTATSPFGRKETATHDVTMSRPEVQFMDNVKDQLRLHMEKMRKEHKYQLVTALRRARTDINKAQHSQVSQYCDEVSPFKKMRSIELRESDLDDDMDVSQYHAKIGIKHTRERGTNSFGDNELIYCPFTDIRSFKDFDSKLINANTQFNLVPKYHIYTTLANNIMVEDDEILRFQPYLGEEADEVNDPLLFEENYPVDITRHARENGQQREMVEWICDDVPRLLTKFQTSFNAISYYLIGDLKTIKGVDAKVMERTRKSFFPPDHDPDYHKTKNELRQRKRKLRHVDADELHRAEMICKALREVVGVRAWFFLKAISNEGKHRALQPAYFWGDEFPALLPTDNEWERTAEEHKLAILSGGNSMPYHIDSYTKLHCPVCYMHQCPFHTPVDSDSDDDYKLPPQEQSIYDGDNANTYPDSADKPCSELCFIKESAQYLSDNKSLLKPWSTAQKEVLTQSLVILFHNQRAACMLASVINRPCVEIHQAILERQKTAEVRVPMKQLEPQQVRNRRRKGGLLRLKKKTDILGYPRDCAVNTQEALARPPHKGCIHEGVCSKENGCSCVRYQVMCEKTCKCESCIRKWRGCRCARRDIPCLPGQCECRKWNRECDADLCRTCGASETLDPVNRYNLELANSCCGNVEAQRGLPKRTFVGLSNIAAAGLGLFIGEDAKKDSFIGEYLGEIISEPEAERRGVLYDKRGVSFLFNLNKDQVVDAARAGNKLRFINHYHEPNCIARVVMTGVIHRIGMYALRDLYKGEELYFDYGYNENTSNFVRAEPEYMFEPPATVEKPRKQTKTTLARKTKGLKIKKFRPGKKRLRAATKQITTAASVVPQKRPRGRPRKHFPREITIQPSSRGTSRLRRKLDQSLSSSHDEKDGEEESDSDSETSEGSVIMIRNPNNFALDTDSEEEEEEEEEEVALKRRHRVVPDTEDEDEDYRESSGEEEESITDGEVTPTSDEDLPQTSHGQRKRRRMYSPFSEKH